MKDLPQIFYCNVCNSVWDAHGKIYEIKEHRNWKFINVGDKKVGVSSLPIRLKIFSFDDFIFAYWSYLLQRFPCPAMGYYVYQKMSGRSISLVNYFKEFSHIEKINL